jgi:hypothetical protein
VSIALNLHPPYAFEIGQTHNQRLKSAFLEHTYRWLKPGGVLLFVIPQTQLKPCARILSEYFSDLSVFKLTEPASVQHKQIAVLGVRRKRHQHVRDSALLDSVRWLEMLATKVDLESLGDMPTTRYEGPSSGPVTLTNSGIHLDEVEDLLPDSGVVSACSSPSLAIVGITFTLIVRSILVTISNIRSLVPFHLLSFFVPATYFIDITRGIILRGASLRHLWLDGVVLLGMGVVMLFLAARRFQKKVIAV